MASPPPRAQQTPEPGVGPWFSYARFHEPDGSVRVLLLGELDLLVAERACAMLRRVQDETPAVTCDLGDVWFADLHGLRVLIEAAAYATLTGRRFTLANCPPIVARVLRLLEVADGLEIHTAPNDDRG